MSEGCDHRILLIGPDNGVVAKTEQKKAGLGGGWCGRRWGQVGRT